MVPQGLKFAHFCMSGLPRVEKSANFMPMGAIFKKKCKKVLFNSFVIFPAKKHYFCLKIKCALFYELFILIIL